MNIYIGYGPLPVPVTFWITFLGSGIPTKGLFATGILGGGRCKFRHQFGELHDSEVAVVKSF